MEYNKHITELFKRYMEGSLTRAEEKELMDYLRDNDIPEDEFTEILQEAWDREPGDRNDSEEVDREFSQITKKISAKKPLYKKLNPYLPYAAAVLLFFAGTMMWQKHSRRPVESRPVELTMSSKTTQIGEKVKITLSDGTKIYLAGNSTLEWPDTFVKGENREVYLEGEAFFEVKTDSLSPFIVHSGELRTKVLGTSFNIYAYPEDNEVSVAVRTGKVEVSRALGDNLTTLSLLTPGMKILFDRAQGQYTMATEQTDDMNAWVSNRFVFKDTGLPEMLEKLGRYYKVSFTYDKSCLSTYSSFNATFENVNIKDVVEQIHLMSAGRIQYKFENNHKDVKLWKEGCR